MIKIGLYQFTIEWENKESNFAKIAKICEKASNQGVEFLLLPEMSFSGFSMNTEVIVDSYDKIIEKMHYLAKAHSLYIGFGWVGEAGLKCNNHYSVVGPEGVISDYTKIHPFSYADENLYFEGGRKLVWFSINDIKFSSLICYDLRFPEIFQICSAKSHVIIIPACWPQKREEHWECLLKARAIENQSYIVGINCVGNIGGIEYSGGSRVIDPNGKVVAEAESKKEELLTYELNDDVAEYRNSFPVKKDRKESLYKELRNECDRQF